MSNSVVVDESVKVLNADVDESPKRNPKVLFLLAAFALFFHGFIFSIALIASVIHPGEDLVDRYFLAINILFYPTILPMGVYAPLAVCSGHGILNRKKWGLFLYAFIHAMNIAAIMTLILKYPAYITVTKKIYLPMTGCYGFLLISILIFWYLGSKIVRDYFGLQRTYVLKRYAIYLVVAFMITFTIAFFADSVFG